MFISHGKLMDCVTNKYIFQNNLVLSFEYLKVDDVVSYTEKPSGDNQIRKEVIPGLRPGRGSPKGRGPRLFNEDNEPVYEFKSGREMARYFKIDGKVARAAILEGRYQNYIIVVKGVPYRQEILVFDSKTSELITQLRSITAAMKYAKVNFYTMKTLIETAKPHNGKIFKYSINS